MSFRCRWSGVCLCVTALLLVTRMAQAQKPDPKQPATFTFLHIAARTLRGDGGANTFRETAAAANTMPLRPALVIATGGVTDNGKSQPFSVVKSAASALDSANIAFYDVPGSEDFLSRPEGKESFVQAFGAAYRAFDVSGAHFVLLDSTVVFQHFGHIDKPELDWLAKDFKRLKPDTPVFVFLHHGIGREDISKRPLDNEYDLLPLLQTRNVIAVFTGDADNTPAKVNGISVFGTNDISEEGCHRVTVSPLTVTIERLTAFNAAPTALAKIPVRGSAALSKLRSGWDDPDNPYLERRRPAATLEPRAFGDNPDKEKAEYRIDEGNYQPMTRDARDIWRDQFKTKGLSVGIHTATVHLTTSSEVSLKDELIFEVERTNTEAARQWAVDLEGPIQSSPVVSGDLVFAASLDGRVTALLKTYKNASGKQKWTYKTKGAIVAAPLVSGDTVYVGSSDGSLYALEAGSGKLRWKTDLGAPVITEIALAKGVICAVTNGRNYVGVNATTGNKQWGLIGEVSQNSYLSNVTTDGERFYFGGWRSPLFALDPAHGAIVWTAPNEIPEAELESTLPDVSKPFAINGRVFAVVTAGRFRAFDARTGERVWEAKGNEFGSGKSAPSGDNLTLYLAAGSSVSAVDAVTGTVRWSTDIGQQIIGASPKLSPDGRSLVSAGFRGRIAVLDTARGGILWQYELGPGNIFSTPDYDGKTVYTTTMANDVQALNAPEKK